MSPPEGHHYADAEFVGQVEKPFRWSMVDAHAIHSDVTHHREIDAGFLRRTDVIAAGIWRERAICDTLEEELVIAFEEELCACAHPVVHSGTGTESNTTCPAGKILDAEGLSITGEDSAGFLRVNSRQCLALRLPFVRLVRCRLPYERAKEIRPRIGKVRNKRRSRGRRGNTEKTPLGRSFAHRRGCKSDPHRNKGKTLNLCDEK